MGARATAREAAATVAVVKKKRASRDVEAFGTVTVVGGEETAPAVVLLTDQIAKFATQDAFTQEEGCGARGDDR